MAKMVFTYMWEYDVNDKHIDAFEHAYGPDGDWVRFFMRSEAYLGTELHRDITKPGRFVTVDHWTTKTARDRFQKVHETEFKSLDEACGSFTISEKLIGEFECFMTSSSL